VTNSPQTLTPAGRRILDAASQLFYQEGIHAVGVEAIAAAADVTKKTLYACFGSKDQLVAAYLQERDQRWRSWLTGWVDAQAGSDVDRLLATFDAMGKWLEKQYPRGCSFINALAELPSSTHPGHPVILEQKQWMLDYLTELASAVGVPSPENLGKTLMILHEGIAVSAATGCPADASRQARASAAELIAALRAH
jgi:AcrR family transcriptional regulator